MEREIIVILLDDDGLREESQAVVTLEDTGRDMRGATNLRIGIDAMDVVLTHIQPESLAELGRIMAEWAEARQ